MTIWRAEQFRASIKKEEAYGYKTGTTAWVPSDITDPIGYLKGYEPPDPEVEWRPYRRIGAQNSRTVEDLVEGRMDLKGNVPYTLQDPRMLAFALGSDSVTDNTTYQTHLIKPNVTLPSFGMCVSRLQEGATNDINRVYSGCKVDQMTLAAEESGELKGAFSMIAQNVVKTENLEAPTVVPLQDEQYWFYQSAITFWGTTIGRLQSFELSITNGLQPKRYFKDAPRNTLSELLEGEQKFSIKADIAIDDADIYDELLGGSNFDIEMIFTRGTNDILKISSDIDVAGVVGGTNNNCYITKAPHNVPETNEVIVPVEMVLKRMYFEIENQESTAYV